MQKSKLKPGELYNHQPSLQYNKPAPARLLDVEKLWSQKREGWRQSRQTTPGRAATFGGDTVGYLVVTCDTGFHADPNKTRDDYAREIAALQLPDQVTPESVKEFAAGLPKDLRLAAVNNAQLRGPWDVEWKKYQAAERARTEQRVKEREGAERRLMEYRTTVDLLPSGVTVRPVKVEGPTSHERVTMSVADLRKLLDDLRLAQGALHLAEQEDPLP